MGVARRSHRRAPRETSRGNVGVTTTAGAPGRIRCLCNYPHMPDPGQNLDLSITLGRASFQASGPADLVMQALTEFKGLTASAPATSDKPDSETTTITSDAESSVDETPATKTPPPCKVPLPKFLESEAIKGNDAIATAIVIWAEDHDGKAALTKREIEATGRARA